jgi:F-type H+-transporting ATPase subunit delta
MSIGLIPTRYAKALLEFAGENSNAELVYEEAKVIVLVLNKTKEVNLALRNPKLPDEDKQELMLKLTGKELSDTLKRFMDLLLENKREDLLRQIMLKYIDFYRKDNKINHTKLITATPIDAETEQRLIKLIEAQVGGTVELEKQIRPEILGGFQIEVNHLRWDATLSGQLKQLRKDMLNGNEK